MSAPQDGPGVPARRAALRLLDAVLRQGLPLESALAKATRELDRPEDRGLAHAITAAALRRLPDLDALIDGATRNRLPDDAKARFVLRIALAQALLLDTPPHAAISTVLPLIDSGPKRLVHGVFGTLMRQKVRLPDLPTLPLKVAQRWDAQWGEAAVNAAARLIAAPPPLDLMGKAGVAPEPEGESLLPGHKRLPPGTEVTSLPGFAEGHWWVQDIAASLPARLIGQGPGTALDLCAAPGGKTMQLASAGWQVTALDASESRLARLSDNLARTGLEAEVVAADLMRWTPTAPADAVLLDAPCSATGTFRRHPEVLHRVRPKAVMELSDMQSRMLARAADWVKPGGTLVYAVCSLEPQEGEQVAQAFLAARDDYALAPPKEELLPGLVPEGPGWLRLRPDTLLAQGGADSFFIAKFVRR